MKKNISLITLLLIGSVVFSNCGKKEEQESSGVASAKKKEVVLAAKDEMQTYKYEDAKIQVAVPAKWSIVKDEQGIEIYSPNEEIYVQFQILSAAEIDPAMDEIGNYIKKELPDFEVVGKPIEEPTNGMDSFTIVGTSASKGIAVGISLIKTPADKLLAIYTELTPAAAEKYKNEIEEIDKSLKPME